MALDLDGFAALRSIAAHPRAFQDIPLEASKAARSLVLKQLKAKGSDAKTLHNVRKALGTEQFSLLLDGIAEKDVKSLLSKFDKHHPELKESNARWRLQHLRSLADGTLDPVAKPQPAPKRRKATRKPKASEIERLSSKAMGAVRKRQR